MAKPILMLGLDGWSQDIADALIAEGRLPTLSRLLKESAVAALDHGGARRTGLAWEHVSTGLTPERARRWGAVEFDPQTYRAEIKLTRLSPFVAALPVTAVVFDLPYFDLAATPNAQGLVNWGVQSPGVAAFARPADLTDELGRRFGPYPAKRYIYGEVWYDPDETKAMADALVKAVDVRTEATEWLLAERFPVWDIALVVVSEFHPAAEALYHGWDKSHPLHSEPGAAAARSGIVGVYEAADRMFARLLSRFPDATLALVNLHGMGPNLSDVANMALLPELMHRMHSGKPLIRDHAVDASGRALPPGRGGWSHAVTGLLPKPPFIERAVGRAIGRPVSSRPMHWMPSMRYQPGWRRMDAFALPSFSDGRIRVNLAGRESRGTVSRNDYAALLDRIEDTLMACRHPDRDEPIVARIDRHEGSPFDLDPSQADLVVLWRNAPLGLVHPRYGSIGPFPYRRTGGHTGGDGIACFHSDEIRPGTIDRRSAFDVAPTIVELLGHRPHDLSGQSFADLMQK